jgi:hypothetical protein
MNNQISPTYDELDLHYSFEEKTYKLVIKKIEAPIFKEKKQYSLVLYGFPFSNDDLSKGRSGTENSSIVLLEMLFEKRILDLTKVQNKLFYSPDSFMFTDIEKASYFLKKELESLWSNSKNLVSLIIGGNKIKENDHIEMLFRMHPETPLHLIFIETGVSGLYIKQNVELYKETLSLFKSKKEKNLLKITIFACQGNEISGEDQLFMKKEEIKIIWLEKNIRRRQHPKNELFKTQAGQVFWELLNESKENENIYLVWSVDSISSAFCPGVSFPAVCGGLSDEESGEIGFLAGEDSRIIGIEMNNFNPAVEKTRTGKFLVEIIIKLIEGLGSRKK